MDPRVEKIMKAADYISARLEGKKPFAGIVLGSGLGKLADKIENQIVVPYRDIPGFPVSTAVGIKEISLQASLEASLLWPCRDASIIMRAILWSW